MTSTPDEERRRRPPEPPEYGGAARSDHGGQPAPEAVREAFEGVENLIRGVSSAAYEQMRERAEAQEALRDGVLASDAERDHATRVLSDAFAAGRLTSEELEQRTSRVLAARTHGELDDVLAGLGGYQPATPKHPGRKVLFAVVAVLTAPFTLIGVGATLGGVDAGDRVFGIVLLAVIVPLLHRLWRWASPRR